MPETYDVAIIGGGPAGATAGTLLRKYNPSLRVVIFEREKFPRDHIGESLLPPISPILAEMGVWDAIEGADFPIKIGATYRWGQRPELWDFDFYPPDSFKDEPRPAKYEGQRVSTAFQVDRSIYDKILLDRAKEVGCEVREETHVAKVLAEEDTVQGLELASGELIQAKHYVDASGNSGILRRALKIECDYPTTLKNIAIYDYWQNADWAVKIGVGGTRIQVRSLGYGWIWFIPLGPARTSIGLVIPAEYYKKSGKRPEELYTQALQDEPTLTDLLKNAHSEGKLQTTRDWSFLAQRQAGANWFLIGECAGFADPILSAGVTMAHVAGLQAAYTILELDRGKLDPNWLKSEFQRQQQERISTHIRFGDFWYTANKQLTDLKEFTSELAREVGLGLDPESAWDWISRGGFVHSAGSLPFGLGSLRKSGEFLLDVATDDPLYTNNIVELNLDGAKELAIALYADGGVQPAKAYVRDGLVLPVIGPIQLIEHALFRERDLNRVMNVIRSLATKHSPEAAPRILANIPDELESMIRDGWVRASYNPNLPLLERRSLEFGFHWNEDSGK